jgi:hypothetical protein
LFWDDARRVLSRAVEFFWNCLSNISAHFKQIKKKTKATQLYTTALIKRKGDPEAAVGLARVRIQMNQITEAIAMMEDAMAERHLYMEHLVQEQHREAEEDQDTLDRPMEQIDIEREAEHVALRFANYLSELYNMKGLYAKTATLITTVMHDPITANPTTETLDRFEPLPPEKINSMPVDLLCNLLISLVHLDQADAKKVRKRREWVFFLLMFQRHLKRKPSRSLLLFESTHLVAPCASAHV